MRRARSSRDRSRARRRAHARARAERRVGAVARMMRRRPRRCSGRADARLLVVDARGRIAHACRAPRSLDLPARRATSSSPTTRRRCRRACAARHARAARRSRCASPAGARSPATTSRASSRSSSARATSARAPRTAPLPPPLAAGDALVLGPLDARPSCALLGHPRLVGCASSGAPTRSGPASRATAGRSSTRTSPQPLALWDVWTPIAARPVAFEPPSAGFALDWQLLDALRARGVGFATLTHAAGLSSTGDAALDARLPLDEPYRIPRRDRRGDRGRRARAAAASSRSARPSCARSSTRRATRGGVRAGAGIADQRSAPRTRLRVVDALLTRHARAGHEPLRAAARVRRRRDARARRRGARVARLPHARVRRLDADRARRRAPSAASRART